MKLLPLAAALMTGFFMAGFSPAAEILETALTAKFPAEIERVAVGEKDVVIRGRGEAGKKLLLAELPLNDLLDGPQRFTDLTEISPQAEGAFTVTLPRMHDSKDRLISRWQLVGEAREAISQLRYADEIFCRAPDLAEQKPKTKKGLGGWQAGPFPGELDALGIDAVTVNVMIGGLVSLKPEAGATPFDWQGKIYYAREKPLAAYDETFRQAEGRGAVVSAILLIANPARDGGGDEVAKLLGHPDAVKEGIFAMPNFTTAEGVGLYGAILNLMAERWSKAGGPHGRVHHWIMHNEVDAGWEWTNVGEKTDIAYLEIYQRSMRLMSLIARQYDPHSRPFISLTHQWADRGNPKWYGSKRLLDLLAEFTAAEGDFPWGLAFHPYPENLFEPKTWDDHQSTFGFNTRQITPKNLEVLDAYLKQPQFLDHGQVRPIHLSENGFNSKDYSDAALAEQAAGMALAWKKISTLSSIQAWEYHNWIDNRGEGGLKIGLRKFPDEPGDPAGKKPIWQLYQALGTPREDEACAPYLKVIGISSWAEISQPVR
jgi:hypothetical protein